MRLLVNYEALSCYWLRYFLLQDQYDYHFLKLYTCKRLLPELDISRLLYVATLTAFLLFFSIQNMNLASRNTKFTSRYSQDGRITTITIFTMCIIYGVLGTGIYVAHQNPLSYKISYWMVTALSTLHSLTVLAVLYLWKVRVHLHVCMYPHVTVTYVYLYA